MMKLFRVFNSLNRTSQFLRLRSFSQFHGSSILQIKPAFEAPALNVISKRWFDDRSDNTIRSLFDDNPIVEDDDYVGNFRRESSFSHLSDELFQASTLSSFPKDFHNETVTGSQNSDEEISNFLEENSITLSGNLDISPVLNFSQLNFPDYLSENLSKMAFSSPTPIQSLAWPVTLSGKDLVGIAQTGSGKTLSYILPAIVHIEAQKTERRSRDPVALVIVPTRELVMQCANVVRKVAGRQIRSVSVYGGASRVVQLQEINRGCQLMIATPGRLLDFVSSREVSLRNCTYLVLDEADRMLDMGFERDIRKVVGQIRPDRQFTMWSATWPDSVRGLAKTYLNSSEGHVYVKVGSSDLSANKNVKQNFEVVHSREKMKALGSLIEKLQNENAGNAKMIVFCNTKRECDYLSNFIWRSCRISSEVIHGDKSQSSRDHALSKFKRQKDSILVATEVAARGLDVSDVDYVINYDLPKQCVDYIHRIGRTGRAGKKGEAYSLLCETDGAIVNDLIENLKNVDHPVDEKLIQMQQWYREKSHVKKSKNNYSNSRYNSGYNTQRNRGYNRYDMDGEGRSSNYNNRSYNRDNNYNSNRRFDRTDRKPRYDDDGDYSSGRRPANRNQRYNYEDDEDHPF